MIPRTIHYVWFGKNPLPEDAKKCIESWRKYCPNFEIKEWNEDNFPVDQFSYAREAYEAKKWAFVSDVARLYALVNQGGIYMDTDVEVIAPLEEFLHLRAFSGFETDSSVPTGIMASEKHHPFFVSLLDEYREMHFINQDGVYDLTTNVTRITDACLKEGLVPNNTFQEVGDVTFYPKDFFCPLNHKNGRLVITNNTHTIHWFAGSWKSEREKNIHKRAISIREEHTGYLGVVVSWMYENSFKTIDIIKSEGTKALVSRIRRYIDKQIH